jgi:hypothetical protein
MIKTTLQKITLTTMSLLATFALSAQAGTPFLSPAKYQQSFRADKVSASARVFSPLATYQFDDGTMEDAVGFGNGAQNFESLWFNQFDVIPGSETITSVEVNWGTPNFPDPTLDGTPVTIAVWSDPNGDGSPTDAVLLGSVAGVISSSGTDTFVTYTLSPAVTLPAGATSFFVGDMTPMNNGPEQFMQGLDENSTLHRQSWIAAMSSGGPVDINMPGNNDFLGLIDDFGLPGNWGIRANSGEGGGGITLSVTLRHQGGTRLAALSWSPADGGSINVLRDGAVLRTTDDDGLAQDNLGIGRREVHTYQVCETDTGTCSNAVEVRVPGSGQ